MDDYLEHEREEDEGEHSQALILSVRGGPLNRSQVNRVLKHLAEENKHRSEDRKLTLHPHQLRHTFGSWIMEKTGSEVKTAEYLGHSSTKYVGRYTRFTQEEEEELLEAMSARAT